MQKYNLLAVPVVDDQQILRGIVTVDDVIDVIEEEATEDLYRAGGVSEAEQEIDIERAIWPSIKARLPWLLGLLFLKLALGQGDRAMPPCLTGSRPPCSASSSPRWPAGPEMRPRRP